MNGAHDMGGTMGFGPVAPEADEPVFHADWERRVLALAIAMGPAGGWPIDASRFARENVPPPVYLSRSYYEIWLAGLLRLLEERGLVGSDEIEAGHALGPAKPVARVVAASDVAPMLARGASAERSPTAPPRYKVGDKVRARNSHPSGHTRLPRYVRGHRGTVELVHGTHVFPDTNASGDGENPQWLYTVRFAAPELWGESADARSSVSVDAFESYLEPVS